jgi:hypothetical protein
MSTKREGYLLIDHTFSPGLTPEMLHAAGIAGPAVGADKRGEFATVTCAHCSSCVILNPLRTRAREYCPRCDAYVCDVCAVAMAQTGVCCSIDKLLDFVQEHNSRLEDKGIPVTCLPNLSPLLTKVSLTVPKSPLILGE